MKLKRKGLSISLILIAVMILYVVLNNQRLVLHPNLKPNSEHTPSIVITDNPKIFGITFPTSTRIAISNGVVLYTEYPQGKWYADMWNFFGSFTSPAEFTLQFCMVLLGFLGIIVFIAKCLYSAKNYSRKVQARKRLLI